MNTKFLTGSDSSIPIALEGGNFKNERLNVADCSTSSRRKPGWRFTAGSTYRTAVFLKRPAPAKIYDVGREYLDLNDTLHLSY